MHKHDWSYRNVLYDRIGVYSRMVVYGAAHIENMRWRNKDEPMPMDFYCAFGMKERSEGEPEPYRAREYYCRYIRAYVRSKVDRNKLTATHSNAFTCEHGQPRTHIHIQAEHPMWILLKLNGFSYIWTGRVYKATMETNEWNFHVQTVKNIRLRTQLITFSFLISILNWY